MAHPVQTIESLAAVSIQNIGTLDAAVSTVTISVSVQTIVLAIGVALLAIGGIGAVLAIRSYRRGGTVAKAAPFTSDLPPGRLTFVDGIVNESSDDDSLESRYGGAPCVAYAAKKVTQESYGKESIRRLPNGGYREWVRKTTEAIPFSMDTDNGYVSVDASNAYVDVADEDYSSVSLAQIRENRGQFIATIHFLISLLYLTNRRRRREYLEARFYPGNPVRVVGTVHSSNRGTGVTIRPGNGVPLIVSTKSQSAIAEGFRSKGKARAFWSLIVIIIGVLLIGVITGII